MYSCGGFPRIYSQNFYCKEWTTTVVNLPSKLVFQQNLVLAGSSWWVHLLPNVCIVLWNVNILESNNLFNIGDRPKCDGICNLVATAWCKRQQRERNHVLPGARQGLQVRTSLLGCFLDLPYSFNITDSTCLTTLASASVTARKVQLCKTMRSYLSIWLPCVVCCKWKSYWFNIDLVIQAHIFFLSLEVRSWCKCWLQQAMVIGWLWRGKGSPWPWSSSVSSGPILLIWTWTPQITMVKQQTKHENWPILDGSMYLSPHEPKIATFSGRTALHLAACEGHLACVRWFNYDLK